MRRLTIAFLLASIPSVAWACLKDCSQHGECSGPGENAYCMCEPGYTGDACDIRLCPKGDDPLTKDQNSREILFGFDSLTGDLGGLVGLVFMGERALLPARADQLSDDGCSMLLSALPSIGRATCKRISMVSVAGGANYSLTLDSFPTFPYENNLYPNDGNPSLDSFQCETDRVTTGEGGGSVVCYLEDRVTTNIKEYAECSNHGACDRITGRCACELGFHGPACDDITDDEDVTSVVSEGPFYTGTMVRIQAAKEPSEDFNVVRASAGGQDLVSITGKGDVTVHRGTLRVEEGGTVVEGGGLVVASGGIGVEDDGLEVASSSASSSVGVLAALSPGFHGAVLRMEAATATSDDFDFIRAKAGDGRVVFGVKGSGRTDIYGGVQVSTGGLMVDKGQAILGDGAVVLRYLNVRGGLVVSEGLEVGASDPGSAVLRLSRKQQGPQGVDEAPLLEARVGEATVMEVAGSGRITVEAGGVHVRGGGVVVDAGGQDIKSGGLRVDGGIEIRSGGLTLSDDEGFKIRDGGLRVSDRHAMGSALSAESLSEAFAGSVLQLAVPHAATTMGGQPGYHFLRCRGLNGSTPFAVESDGSVRSGGGLHAPGSSVLGDVSIRARAALGKTVVSAGESIVVDAWTGTSFLEIADDEVESSNRLVLDREGAETGQLLFVKNSDAQDTTGVVVPSGATHLFLFDGQEWTSLGVHEASTVSLGGVKAFRAAANLDIGDYSLAARSFLVSSQHPTRMAFYGPAGLLSGSDDVRLTGDGVMRVRRMAVDEMAGPLDLKGNSLRNAVIEHASISGLRSLRTDRLHVSAEVPGGSLAVAAERGEVTFPPGLSYDASTGTLATRRLRVDEGLEVEGGLRLERIRPQAVEGKVDCKEAVLVSPRIEGGEASGLASVSTDRLQLSGLSSRPGEVLMLGKQGQVVTSGPSGLHYEAASGTLSARRLEVEEIKDLEQLIRGDLLADQTLHNVTISGGRLEGISFLMVDSIDIKGRAAIDGETFISGSLTVEGTVMGSGPYVDTSDGRFKEDITPLHEALELISQMRGVRYRFQDHWRLRRRLEEGPQIGFIAQEVEKVLPELVHTDGNGYKYVAYGKVVPLLVEGLKDVWGMVKTLQEQHMSSFDGAWERLIVSSASEGSSSSSSSSSEPSAQEPEAAVPTGVLDEEEDTMSPSTEREGAMVSMLARRMAELEAENAKLKEQVEGQEQRLRRLEALLLEKSQGA